MDRPPCRRRELSRCASSCPQHTPRGDRRQTMFGSHRIGTLATDARKVVVSTQVTLAQHEALGLKPDHLLRMHRWMHTARLIDEASFRQNRMGRAPFVVPVSGHEGCQIGTAAALVPGVDVWVPYYRDLGVVLVAGLTPYEV